MRENYEPDCRENSSPKGNLTLVFYDARRNLKEENKKNLSDSYRPLERIVLHRGIYILERGNETETSRETENFRFPKIPFPNLTNRTLKSKLFIYVPTQDDFEKNRQEYILMENWGLNPPDWVKLQTRKANCDSSVQKILNEIKTRVKATRIKRGQLEEFLPGDMVCFDSVAIGLEVS